MKVAIGLGIVWAGYALGIWGYCLAVSYNVPFPSLFKNTWPGGAGEGGGTPVLPGAREGGGAPVLGA